MSLYILFSKVEYYKSPKAEDKYGFKYLSIKVFSYNMLKYINYILLYGSFSYYFIYFKPSLFLGIFIPDYLILYLSITILFNVLLVIYALKGPFTFKFFVLFVCNVIIILLLKNILLCSFPELSPYLSISWLGVLFLEWFDCYLLPELTKIWPKSWSYLLDDYDSEPSQRHRNAVRKQLRTFLDGYKDGYFIPELDSRIIKSRVSEMTAYRIRTLFMKPAEVTQSWFCVADLAYPKKGTFLTPISTIRFSSYGSNHLSYVSVFYPVDSNCDLSSIPTVTFRVGSENKVYAYLGELALSNYTSSRRIFIKGPGAILNKIQYDPGNPEHENKELWYKEFTALIKLGIPRPRLAESIVEIEEIKEGWKNEYIRCNVHKKN